MVLKGEYHGSNTMLLKGEYHVMSMGMKTLTVRTYMENTWIGLPRQNCIHYSKISYSKQRIVGDLAACSQCKHLFSNFFRNQRIILNFEKNCLQGYILYLNPFDMQFNIHLVLQTTTVIG